jgi:hypothetical protein
MSEWIKRQAESIKQKDQEAAASRRSAMDRSAIIDREWLRAWEQIAAAVKSDVEVFNAQFPDEPSRHLMLDQPTGTELRVRQLFQPGCVRILRLEASNVAIKVALDYVDSPNRGKPLPAENIRYSVDESGVFAVGKNSSTPQEISEIALRHLFD